MYMDSKGVCASCITFSVDKIDKSLSAMKPTCYLLFGWKNIHGVHDIIVDFVSVLEIFACSYIIFVVLRLTRSLIY